LDQFKKVWLVDFEFISHTGERPVPVCLSAQEMRSGRKLLVWQDQFGSKPPYDVSSESLFVAYFASAELGCHRALGWKQPARILDLYCEFRNCTNGLPLYNGKGLVGALSYYGLNSIGADEKTEMRDLVLRGGPWLAEEKLAVLQYCQSDTDALARLLSAMLSSIDFPRALLRGRYMSAVSAMEHVGVPIDTDTLSQLRENWESIQDKLVADVDSQYGVYDERSFRAKNFEAWLHKRDIPWPRLESGLLALDSDTFREMTKIVPEVSDLAHLRHSLSEMRLNELQVGADGFNRCLLSPFSSRTGRNQPSNTKYIFGPSTWLRSLIKPKEGHGVAYIDWEQQEFGIAAALSNDAKMKFAYESGDPYLEFAKQARAVPESATKKSHSKERDLFKACVLGVQYGMGEGSLAGRIGGSTFQARKLLRLHRDVYSTFWRWSDNTVDRTILTGKQQSVFGWTNRVKADYNARSLRNFFMQANGAEMLRLACCLGIENGIAVCAPVHDAILITAPLEQLNEDIARMQSYMEEGSRIVLEGFALRTEVAAKVKFPDRYSDKRGMAFWDKIISLLPNVEARPVALAA
jgi:hypothetical protein